MPVCIKYGTPLEGRDSIISQKLSNIKMIEIQRGEKKTLIYEWRMLNYISFKKFQVPQKLQR